MWDAKIEEIHKFWFGEKRLTREAFEAQTQTWFSGGEAMDRAIEERFGSVLEAGARGELEGWTETLRGQVALIVLLDQFSRNVYRGTARAFAQDAEAQRLALELIDSGRDEALHVMERVFVYTPLEHAEDVALQRRCVELFKKLPEAVDAPEVQDLLERYSKYAVHHHDIIERFGRFPHRNAAMGRENTPEEEVYLEDAERFGQ